MYTLSIIINLATYILFNYVFNVEIDNFSESMMFLILSAKNYNF